MKKTISLLLALVLALSLTPAVFAASDEALEAANKLHELGLFNGVGTNADGSVNFDLDRSMTRAEAVTMLVRLLGKEEDAKAGSWAIPFTDVADWAKPYVGYAYANGLTSGTGATTFSGSSTVSATQYLTFVLRALGYSSGNDFQWDKAWELTDKLGITKGQFDAKSALTRGEAVIIVNNALSHETKLANMPLLDYLQNPDDCFSVQDTKMLLKIHDEYYHWCYTIDSGAVYCIKSGELYANSLELSAIYCLAVEIYTIDEDMIYPNHVDYNSATKLTTYGSPNGAEESDSKLIHVKTDAPQWVRYMDKTVFWYDPASKNADNPNAIRYENDYINVNDLLSALGINKSVSIGCCEGLYYLEVK